MSYNLHLSSDLYTYLMHRSVTLSGCLLVRCAGRASKLDMKASPSFPSLAAAASAAGLAYVPVPSPASSCRFLLSPFMRAANLPPPPPPVLFNGMSTGSAK